jgi:ABC-type uncharacterized transport system permease subunit
VRRALRKGAAPGRPGSRSLADLIPVGAAVLALIVGAGLIALANVSPLRAYGDLLRGAFGSRHGIAETLVKTTPLLLAGLGMAIAYRGKIMNIGAEGQILLGAVGAAYVGLYMGQLSPAAGIPLALLAGFLLGALWAGIAAVTRLKFGASELITTLMLNYIAVGVVSYLIAGPWKDPKSINPFTALITPGVRLPVLLSETRLHAGIFVALLATLAAWYLLRHTVYGYQLNVVGASPKTAEYSGIRTGRLLLGTMLLSGGLAGLAGACELAGLHYRLLGGLSASYGYTAIAIALLGRGKPIGVLIAAFLFAALTVGGDGMQQNSRVPVQVILIIQGLLLLFVLGSETFRARRKLAESKGDSKAEGAPWTGNAS